LIEATEVASWLMDKRLKRTAQYMKLLNLTFVHVPEL
jgi:hypothetical protein